MCVYIYIYICVCVYIHIYMYTTVHKKWLPLTASTIFLYRFGFVSQARYVAAVRCTSRFMCAIYL